MRDTTKKLLAILLPFNAIISQGHNGKLSGFGIGGQLNSSIAIKYSRLVLAKVIFWVSLSTIPLAFLNRDARLQSVLVHQTPEFGSRIFCPSFPACFRLSSDVAGLTIRKFFEFLGNIIFSLNPTNTNYITHAQKVELFSDFSSIAFRVICLLPLIIYFLKKINSSITTATLMCFSIASIISGYPLIYIHSFFDMYFTIPDYGALFVLGVFLLYKEQITNNFKLWIAFSIFSVLTFENLSLVFALSLLILNRKNWSAYRKHALASLIVTIVVPGLLIAIETQKSGWNSLSFPTPGYYGAANFTHLHKVIAVLLIIFVWPLLLGIASAYLPRIRKLKYSSKAMPKNDNNELAWIKALLFAFGFSYFVGLFNSGLASEGARQTLAGQILFLILGILKFSSRNSKRTNNH